MKVSLIGPSNIEKLSQIIGKSPDRIKNISAEMGRTLAKNGCQLVVVFDYVGILQLVGGPFKSNGGKLEMLYTENDYDWYTDIYTKYLKEADIKTKKDSWHDLLLSLIKDSDLVICAGLSAGVFTEMGYMKWNFQERKGNVKALIGIKELLPGGKMPKELTHDKMGEMIKIISVNDLQKTLLKFKHD
jgi:hypothetical protein